MAYKDTAQKTAYQNKYIKENYDRINLTLPGGYKARLQGLAASHGQSVNGYLKKLIDEAMEKGAAGGGSGFSAPVDD